MSVENSPSPPINAVFNSPWLVIAVLAPAFFLPLPLLAAPLHHDEALYAYWARLIAGGHDVMLNTVPVDKPPLFIYTVALMFKLFGPLDAVARFPSLLAHVASCGLVYLIGRALYRPSVGLTAALALALSPFGISFAPTILTDPLLVALVLAACYAAIRQRPGWAGLLAGLAAATKQQGLFFLPLVLAWLVFWPNYTPAWRKHLSRFALFFAPGLLIPLGWDLARAYRPGFWWQSSLSYGPVGVNPAGLGERLAGFADLLAYFSASPWLNAGFLIGLLALVGGGLRFKPRNPHCRADQILAGFSLAFVLGHALITFQIWDRYLLGLLPLLALLAARILRLPVIFIESRPKYQAAIPLLLVAAPIVVLAALGPATPVAMSGGYPLGGDHGAYTGVKETAAYLRGHAGANVTLYHHRLGAHWQYYLFDFPYDLRYWETVDDLAQQAAPNASGEQYVAFPAWESTTLATAAIAGRGLALHPVFRTYQANGAPALYLYQLVQK